MQHGGDGVGVTAPGSQGYYRPRVRVQKASDPIRSAKHPASHLARAAIPIPQYHATSIWEGRARS
jgi:hypothetical protein